MYWLKGTADIAFVFNGKVIPKGTDNGRYLILNDKEYEGLLEHSVFKALKKAGNILVFTQKPEDTLEPEELIRNKSALLEKQNKSLKDELETLKERLAAKEKELKAAKRAASKVEKTE